MFGSDFYKRFRNTVEGYSGPYAEYVLLVPDMLALVTRLMFDRRVETKHKAYLGVALVYVISPGDILPERVLGPIGYLDDLAILVAVLNILLSEVDERVLLEHWSGEADLLATVRAFLAQADMAIGKGRLDEVLRTVGIRPSTPAV